MNLEELLIPAKKPKGKWDKYVPVIKQDDTISIYLTGEIVEPAEYNEACHAIANATESQTIYVYINSPGGILDSGFMLVNALTEAKANTVAIVQGTVASAGTIITLACKQVIPKPFSTFMIHNYSAGGGGYSKGHELKQRQTYMDGHNVRTFNAIYSGFLTPKEIKEMIDGKDFWMDDIEVTKRLEKRAIYLAKKATA